MLGLSQELGNDGLGIGFHPVLLDLLRRIVQGLAWDEGLDFLEGERRRFQFLFR